jgi:hypothetical protein
MAQENQAPLYPSPIISIDYKCKMGVNGAQTQLDTMHYETNCWPPIRYLFTNIGPKAF